jgi:hypothetical protein
VSLYLPIKAVGGKMTVAVCPRCQKKMYLGDMVKDPNNGMWVCKADQDVFDPWRLPARKTEKINVDHPRPDVTLELE